MNVQKIFELIYKKGVKNNSIEINKVILSKR